MTYTLRLLYALCIYSRLNLKIQLAQLSALESIKSQGPRLDTREIQEEMNKIDYIVKQVGGCI